MTNPIQVELFPELGIGNVVETIEPPECRGRVQFRASQWPARFYHLDCPLTLKPGSAVVVVGMEGITLLVIPDGYLSDTQLRSLRPFERTWQDIRSA